MIKAWNYFSKTLQYLWQTRKYRQTFEYVNILNTPGIRKVLNKCEYAFD